MHKPIQYPLESTAQLIDQESSKVCKNEMHRHHQTTQQCEQHQVDLVSMLCLYKTHCIFSPTYTCMYMYPNCYKRTHIHINVKEFQYADAHYQATQPYQHKTQLHNQSDQDVNNQKNKLPHEYWTQVTHKTKRTPDILAWLRPIGSTKTYKRCMPLQEEYMIWPVSRYMYNYVWQSTWVVADYGVPYRLIARNCLEC